MSLEKERERRTITQKIETEECCPIEKGNWLNNNEARPRERSDRGRFLPSGKKSLFIAGRTSMRRVPKIKNKNIFL